MVAPPVELFIDIAADRLRVVGHYGEGFVAVQGLNDRIHQHGFKGQTQQGEETGLHVEDQQGGGGNEHIGDKQGPAHIHAGVFFQDHGHDVGASGGGVHIKKDGRAQGGEDDGEEELQHFLVGEGPGEGEKLLKKLNEKGIEQRAVDRSQTKGLVQDQKAQKEKQDGDDRVDGGGGGKMGGDQLPQQDGKTGDPAHGEMIGKFKEIDAGRDKGGAQSHKEKGAETSHEKASFPVYLPCRTDHTS